VPLTGQLHCHIQRVGACPGRDQWTVSAGICVEGSHAVGSWEHLVQCLKWRWLIRQNAVGLDYSNLTCHSCWCSRHYVFMYQVSRYFFWSIGVSVYRQNTCIGRSLPGIQTSRVLTSLQMSFFAWN